MRALSRWPRLQSRPASRRGREIMARLVFRPRWIVAAVLLIAGSATVSGTPASAQATPPARFFGTAYLRGVPAPPGTVVEARIGGVFCGAGFVSGSGMYSVDAVS